ncbi:MAG: hypothetical protein ABI678_05935 [Kofleriaceae bacterium]
MITRAVLVASLSAACSDPAARVRIAPIDLGSTCGNPEAGDVQFTRVIAYGPFADKRRTDPEIADFPANTEQLGVELVGGMDGQTVLATGKTPPLAYNDLADATTIPVAMVPLDGFCPLRGMTVPRVRPLVAHAGTGVIVVGGNVAAMPQLIAPSAEFYDPATATFTPVPLPMPLAETPTSLVGAAIAELRDGRAVVWSGQAFTVFDPVKMAFTNPVFVEQRSEHAMFGIDASHLLVTGGCQLVTGLDCAIGGTVRRSSVEYELDAEGALVGNGVVKPALPATSVRFGGRLFDIGITSDGKRRFVLAAAPSDPTTADQLPFSAPDDDGLSTVATNFFSQVTELDGGALLTAFDPDGEPSPTGPAAILPAEGGDALALLTRPPAITGARLITLEDGTVVALGGEPGLARYQPTTSTWSQAVPTSSVAATWPGAVVAPSLIRLGDGSVLVLGGGDTAAPTTAAWLFRPSLVGPHVGAVTAFPDGTGAVLTTPSPATATRVGRRLTLTAPDDAITARALVGGPRLVTGTLDASVANVTGGGVALIAQQTGPARALVARLVPGEAARIERHDGATITTLCSGAMVDVGELTSLHFAVTGDTASVATGLVTKVSCDFTNDPIAPEPGAWGIASTAHGSLDVVTIAVSRVVRD